MYKKIALWLVFSFYNLPVLCFSDFCIFERFTFSLGCYCKQLVSVRAPFLLSVPARAFILTNRVQNKVALRYSKSINVCTEFYYFLLLVPFTKLSNFSIAIYPCVLFISTQFDDTVATSDLNTWGFYAVTSWYLPVVLVKTILFHYISTVIPLICVIRYFINKAKLPPLFFSSRGKRRFKTFVSHFDACAFFSYLVWRRNTLRLLEIFVCLS